MTSRLLSEAARLSAAVAARHIPRLLPGNANNNIHVLGYATRQALDARRWKFTADVIGMANGCITTNVDERKKRTCRVCKRPIAGTYYITVEVPGEDEVAVACRGRCEETLLAELGVRR